MKYKLEYITERDRDFGKIKKDGAGGVIFPVAAAKPKDISEAKKNHLRILVHLSDLVRIKCEYLSVGGVNQDELFAVSASSAEKSLKALNGILPDIDGFCVPYPCIRGLIWDSSFSAEYTAFCGNSLYDELPLLFDADTQYADVRIWYYRRAAEKLFSEFVLPVYNCIKRSGKTVCFDLGGIARGDYAVRKLVLPSLFDNAKIPTVCDEDGTEYFITPKHNKNSNTLLVTPLRHIMEMYVWDFAYSKEESEFSVTVNEENYYRNSFEKAGIKAYIIDDFTFSKMRLNMLKKFDDILLSKGCMIEKSRKDQLLNMGIRIDDEKLLKRLDEVN